MPRRIALAIALCLVMTGCAEESPPTVAGSTTPIITSAIAPRPLADSMMLDDRYQIGVDIRPGVWHTEGPRIRRGFDITGLITGPPVCIWAIGYPRVYDAMPGVVTTVPVAQGEVRGPSDVTLNLMGAEFNTKSCQTWHLKTD